MVTEAGGSLVAPVLYVIAWKADDDSRWAQGSADALIIMASGTLAWLTGLIAQTVGSSAAEFAAYIATERAKWGKLITDLKLRVGE